MPEFFIKKAGFSLIELLLVLSVVSIIAITSAPIYGNLQASNQLHESVSQIIQTLRLAQGFSMARMSNPNASYGVFFEINDSAADKFILYQGVNYILRNVNYDRLIILDNSLSLATTLNGNEINFSKSLGLPNNTGAITLTHNIGGANFVRAIKINSLGAIEEE